MKNSTTQTAFNIPADLTKPSAAYKSRAWLAMISLLLFMVIYLALAIWFGWTAYRLFAEQNFTFNDGVVGVCVGFLAVFMLKAIFFIQRTNLSDTLEVTEQSHPQLFAFLYRLADQAGAPRPKRVYLSARVNAMVFYDLSIVNLLFPSHKNLEIGLGLVNALTVSEMKAVLAHEFGHFSQRSMAIGIWVYIAQQIAAQIIAKRDALDSLLRIISNIHIYVAWIGWLLSLIVWSIRSLLDSVFRLVLLAQRSLSRQMEFHADLVAVSMTGSDELIHALYKLQAADEAWARAATFANAELRKGHAIQDIFDVQQRLIDKIAFITDEPDYGKAPALPSEHRALHRVFKNYFVQSPKMWASHPSNVDREENAKRHYLPSNHDDRSAWLLFEQSEVLRAQVTSQLLGKPNDVAAKEVTENALDESYALLQFDPRYRGTYLNRSLTRHALNTSELYDAVLQHADIKTVLAELYPLELKDQLKNLRSLEDELTNLQIIRDDIYRTNTGKIIFRGKEISRRELAVAIQQVHMELEQVKDKILAHDRQCRTAHLMAAETLGLGWRDYLIGLIEVLHYTEHTLSNIRDSYAQLCNVLAVVTADGKVSSSEMKRLLSAADELYDLLSIVFEQSQQIKLDETLCERLKVSEWSAAFEEFKLLGASKETISGWLNVIDSWVGSACYPLSGLEHATLEQLLTSELAVARYFHEQQPIDPAPAASFVPLNYPVLPVGKERSRLKLSWWDRFYTGDGLFLGAIRTALAIGIVGAVVFYGNRVGLETTISIFNGLSRPVQVNLPNTNVAVGAFSAITVETELGKTPIIETTTMQHDIVERFTPAMQGHGQHYVYNVAGATPLFEETIAYGTAVAQPYRILGVPRWLASSADIFFGNPPDSVQTKDGQATRVVLTNVPGDMTTEREIGLLNDDDLKHVILVRAQWDVINIEKWQKMAKSIASDPYTRMFKAKMEQEQQKTPLVIENQAQNSWESWLEKSAQLFTELKKK